MKLLKNVFFALALFGSFSGLTAQPYEPVEEADYVYEDENYAPGIVGGTISDTGRAIEDVGGIVGGVL